MHLPIDSMLKNLIAPYHVEITANDLLTYLSGQKKLFIFIKTGRSVYQYGNEDFIELMGLKNLRELIHQTDKNLCRDKNKTSTYIQHDQQVIEEENILDVYEEVLPKNRERLVQHMSGKLYPMYQHGSKPEAILGIVTTTFLPFKLDLETALSLTSCEINKLLTKPSYPVNVSGISLKLSRREIQCIIELIKGKHAGEIAQTLGLRQTTIESYIINIKNKLGAINKSNLLSIVFREKLLQQVIL